MMVLWTCILWMYTGSAVDLQQAGIDRGFAVVELFTSQGCSSCPAADRFLSRLHDEARTHDENIFVLSYHVTYWNSLGWTDPYSREAYTQRQQKYASIMGLRSVYTPQAIINGRIDHVGSDQEGIRKDLAAELNQETANSILASVDSNYQVQYAFRHPPDPEEVLQVVLVESGLENDVLRGENRGRHLQHEHVVRNIQSVTPTLTGRVQLSIPAGVDTGNATVILLLQHRRTLHISAATQVPVMGRSRR